MTMLSRSLRTAEALVALTLLAAGCSVGGFPAPAASPGGTPAFERVLDRIGDDGKIDRVTALQAFALAFSPPPGVSVPAGPAETIPSGTGPLRWVLAHFGELTPAQQRAVRAVTPRPSSRPVAAGGEMVLMAAGQQSLFEELVRQGRVYYLSRLQGSLQVSGISFTVTLNTRNQYSARAYSFPIDAQGSQSGPVAECDIYVNPKLAADTDDAKREAMFHEVFHCFQAQMVATLDQFYPLPAWLLEGGALWAGDEGAGTAPIAAKWWRKYFATPATPLFKRSYDATGFFSHLQETGGDVYDTFGAAEQAAVSGGNAAAFDALVGSNADRFFATWPTSLLRQPSVGPDWDTNGPGITADALVPGVVPVGNGAAPSLQVPAYANDDRKLTVSAEVVVVQAGQYSHLRATSGSFDSTSPSDLYCTRGADCMCPQGSPQEGVKFKPLDAGAYYLAQGGGPGGGGWSVAAYSLAAFCQQPAAATCLLGTWNLTSPPALPGLISLQKADEVMTIAKDGTLTLDVDIAGSSSAIGAALQGRAIEHILAINGFIQPRSADFSGLSATASLNGTPFLSVSVTQLFPGIDRALTPVGYRCGKGTLTLTGASGLQWIFTKA